MAKTQSEAYERAAEIMRMVEFRGGYEEMKNMEEKLASTLKRWEENDFRQGMQNAAAR